MNTKKNKNEIIVYTNNDCPYCKQVKETLEKENIKYIDRLTSDFKDEWTSVVQLTGIPNVPTILFKGEHFVPTRDFNNVEHLVNILQNYKKSPYNNTKQLSEKVKTLSFNTFMAFNRIDTILKQIETKLNPEKDEHKSTS